MMDKMDEEKKSESVVTKRKWTESIDTSNTLLVVIAVLVIMSGVQVFQTQQLLNAISNGSIKASTQSQNNKVNLPSQVGGCG